MSHFQSWARAIAMPAAVSPRNYAWPFHLDGDTSERSGNITTTRSLACSESVHLRQAVRVYDQGATFGPLEHHLRASFGNVRFREHNRCPREDPSTPANAVGFHTQKLP